MSPPEETQEEREPEEVELSPEERERRAERAAKDVKLLTRYALFIIAAGMGLAFAAVRIGVEGAEPFARGLTVGALTSLFNLRLLARSSWALLADKDAVKGALGIGGSFVLLIGVATYLALRHPELILGFGIGLALPAPAGVWFGLKLRHRPDEVPQRGGTSPQARESP